MLNSDKVVKSFPFYVTEAGVSTLGIDLFRRLHYKLIDPSSQVVAPVLAHNTKIALEQFPTLLNGSVELKYFEHKPIIDLNVKLVIKPNIALTLAICDAVAKELCRMETEGIIEKIDASLCF